MNSEGLTKCQL